MRRQNSDFENFGVPLVYRTKRANMDVIGRLRSAREPSRKTFHTGRFLGIALLLIGLAGRAGAENLHGPLPETLRPWRLAFVRGNNIWVSNGDGTDQKPMIENGQSPSWSPDKSQIAFVRDSTIWVANADGGNQRSVTASWKRHGKPAGALSDSEISISWHPNGRLLTFSHGEEFKVERSNSGMAGIVPSKNAVKGIITASTIFDASMSRTEPGKATVRHDLFEGGTGFFFSDHAYPAWSPSGKQLAFTRNGDIWVAKMEKGSEGEPWVGWEAKRLAAVASYDEPTRRGSRMNLGATQLAWHPNGRLLAYGYDRLQGSGFNEVHLLDTETGKDSIVVRDSFRPRFSPDGNFLVYWTYSRGQCGDGICICAVTLDGRNSQKLVTDGKDPVW